MDNICYDSDIQNGRGQEPAEELLKAGALSFSLSFLSPGYTDSFYVSLGSVKTYTTRARSIPLFYLQTYARRVLKYGCIEITTVGFGPARLVGWLAF